MRFGNIPFFSIILFGLWGTGASFPARSDDPGLDFIRVACVPQDLIFEIDHFYVDGDVVNDKRFDASILKRIGIYSGSGMSYECDLIGGALAKYKVTSTQSDSGCYNSPPITTLTLTHDGKPILEDVAFGEDCERTSITKILIEETDPGWYVGQIEICMSAGICYRISPPWPGSGSKLPITQTIIDSCVKAKSPQLCLTKVTQ